MTRVKICGITSVFDAAMAAGHGAAAIGMVFWPSSPRCIDKQRAREIVSALPPFVSTVGVFVNQVGAARDLAADLRLSAVQFHGDESLDDCRGFGVPVIKAVAVRDRSAVAAAMAYPDDVTVLLDAHDPIRRGGTGTTIDWSVAAEISLERPVILSGGLNAGNVADAIAAVRPWAIDVSSGVEASPGRKDPAKLRDLFGILRQSPFSAFGIRHSSFDIDK
jgi:phosphoribosylanthranilate isomerase